MDEWEEFLQEEQQAAGTSATAPSSSSVTLDMLYASMLEGFSSVNARLDGLTERVDRIEGSLVRPSRGSGSSRRP